MQRALVHVMYLGLSLLFASRFFPLAHPTSFAITEGDRGELRKEVFRQFFDQQPWASVNGLPTGEYIVLIDRAKFLT
jgi:peptidase E